MDNQLVKLINESGIDRTKGDLLMSQFSNYFEMASEWEIKAKSLVITDVAQIAEMKLAREGRLFLKEKRVAVEKTRKILKENALREGQTIDAIARILTNLIEPIEKDLEQKEKFAEIQEAKRIALLREEREREIAPYVEFTPYGLDYGRMDDDNYSKVLNGAKLQMEQKLENERKAEQERIAREKAEAEERERQRLENERLRKEAEERERQLAEERVKAEKERKAIEEKARLEREEAERKAKAEREEQDRLLAIEREKQAKLTAELKAKEDAEKQAKLEAERKAIEEQRKREAEERKARNAPDKEKLLKFAAEFEKIIVPAVNSEEAKRILDTSVNAIEIAIEQLKEKSNNL